MSARFIRPFALVVLLAGLCACSAAVELPLPGPWWRGQPGTTFASWEFNTPNLNPLPDVWHNPNGVPRTEIYPGHEWEQFFHGRYGVWPLSGLIVVDIPNYPPANPFKEILVQLTWASLSPYAEPEVDELLFHRTAELIHRRPVPPDEGLQWWHDTYRIFIAPNPVREVIRIQGAVWVDDLTIDTICVPEPSSLLALGSVFGIAGLAWRRRR